VHHGIHRCNMRAQEIRNILVPIDFSKISIQAIDSAKRLAQRFGSKVHLANVQEPFYPAMFVGAGAPVPVSPIETAEEVRKSAARRLRTLAKANRLTGICDAVISAPVFDEICTIARAIPADLIVMPTHGRTGLKHLFLGSVAERVVQHSPCPVFIARKSKRLRKTATTLSIRTILVPVDFSGCSVVGLKYAIAFAKRVAARLIVFHALDLGYADTADGFAMYDLSALQDAAREAAEGQMRKFLRAAKFGGVKFESVITVGPPLWEICAFAESRHVDLIITATHGWTGFKHVLIGSTAEQVVRYAPCSVLVVPSHPQERAKHANRGREASS
jgi:nucleotide-binding universal stress UspA family protein